MGNPYDDYDALDPREDTAAEEEGNFEYTDDTLDFGGGLDVREDPFDVEGNFDYVEDGLGSAPRADDLPKTMVRKRTFVEPDDRGFEVPELGPKLKRRHKHKKKHKKKGEAKSVDWRDARSAQSAPPVEAPRPEQGRQQRPRRRRHGCLITLLVILVVSSVAAYWVFFHPIDEELAFSPQEEAGVGSSLSWYMPGMPYYVLALGSDAQEGDTYSRSDTMMLIRVDLIAGKLTMLSIPRDTRVQIEGHGMQKINAAYAFGGAGGAVKAVSKLTGARINHVAVVHIDELAGLVDYLGGVTVNVPEAAYDPEHTGIDIDSGLQTLDGETAVAWARTRYGYTRGDFQRQEDQRILMEAIMNRMLSLSPRQMPGAIRQIGDLIGTDMRCYNLIPLAARFKLGSPTVYSCSVPSTTQTIEGVSYVIADEAALKSMMKVIDAGGDPGPGGTIY